MVRAQLGKEQTHPVWRRVVKQSGMAPPQCWAGHSKESYNQSKESYNQSNESRNQSHESRNASRVPPSNGAAPASLSPLPCQVSPQVDESLTACFGQDSHQAQQQHSDAAHRRTCWAADSEAVLVARGDRPRVPDSTSQPTNFLKLRVAEVRQGARPGGLGKTSLVANTPKAPKTPASSPSGQGDCVLPEQTPDAVTAECVSGRRRRIKSLPSGLHNMVAYAS